MEIQNPRAKDLERQNDYTGINAYVRLFLTTAATTFSLWHTKHLLSGLKLLDITFIGYHLNRGAYHVLGENEAYRSSSARLFQGQNRCRWLMLRKTTTHHQFPLQFRLSFQP